ncbi:MAG: hypothetical protein Q9213_008059 [Squamulea squamosa]
MDDVNLPTSPRKKLKAYHDTDAKMVDEPASNVPSTKYIQPTMDTSESEDRLDKEAQCGIVAYVNPNLPGFTGILKKRYTDFLVNEILPNGQVIHLDNLKRPSEPEQLSSVASKNPQQHKGEQSAPVLEDAPPQYESTNLNKIEQASRKREKVYMRHGADTLNLVDGKENCIRDKHTPLNASSSTGKDPLQDSPTTTEQQDTQVPEYPNVAQDRMPDAAGTVSGWQAYAQSNTNGGDSGKSSFQLSDGDKNLLTSYFNTEIVEQILNLFQRILAFPQRKPRDFGIVTTQPIEREVRTDIHQAIRRIFSSRLDSTTGGDGAMVIAAAKSSSNWAKNNNARRNDRKNKPQQPKGKAGWAVLGGDYLHFTLYKENKDTMEVISYLAKQLKLRPQLFSFAGTKDRRSIAVQRVSIYRTEAKRLVDIGRTLRNARIGNFEYRTQGLQLGDLMGNEFVITLRDCHFEGDSDLDLDTKIEKAASTVGTAIENFSQHGFINYYGLQRFGSFTTGTHTIGRSMLQGDFKAACEGILWFSPSALAAAQQNSEEKNTNIARDDMARASALHAFATTGRSAEALEQLPRKFSAEACLVRHLARAENKTDYYGALQTIQRNLRLMYVHAYQSLVWNTAASARWKTHGDKVLPGDLVLINEHPDPSTHTDTTESKVDQDGEPIVAAEASDRAYTSDEIFTRARALTESELASPGCKITIFDIVLPTPGYDILYPANDSANIYKEFMASEEGGGLDPYDMRRKWKDVSLSGSYRKLLAKPLVKMEWDIRAYGAKGDDEQFVETDVDRIEISKRDDQAQQTETQNNSAQKDTLVADKDHEDGGGKDFTETTGANTATTAAAAADDGSALPAATSNDNFAQSAEAPSANDQHAQGEVKQRDALQQKLAEPEKQSATNYKIAVILKLQLGSSTYATMALRELMKEGGVKTWKVEYGGGR